MVMIAARWVLNRAELNFESYELTIHFLATCVWAEVLSCALASCMVNAYATPKERTMLRRTTLEMTVTAVIIYFVILHFRFSEIYQIERRMRSDSLCGCADCDQLHSTVLLASSILILWTKQSIFGWRHGIKLPYIDVGLIARFVFHFLCFAKIKRSIKWISSRITPLFFGGGSMLHGSWFIIDWLMQENIVAYRKKISFGIAKKDRIDR